jgi:hypothetical protein
MYFFFAGIYKGSTPKRNQNKFNKSIGGTMLGIFDMTGRFDSISLFFILGAFF